MALSHFAAKDRFCLKLGRLPPLSAPQMIITWAAVLPFTSATAFTRPSSVSMASRWTSSTTLMLGYFSR